MGQDYLRDSPIFHDGKIKVRYLYQYVEPDRQRPQQWIDRLREQATKAPDEIKQLCRPEIFDRLTSNEAVTAVEALVLLTYSSKSGRYQKAIEKIEEHTKTYYQRNDPKRDRWFKQHHPEITYFRVKHSESDIWLNALSQTKELCSLSTFYAKCIRHAVESRSPSRLRITSASSRNAYDISHNPYAFLLLCPKQRMKEIKGILNRLQIEYSGEKSISISQSTLNRRCLS